MHETQVRALVDPSKITDEKEKMKKIAIAKLFVYHANTKARCVRRLRRLCSEPSHLNQYTGKFSGQKSCKSGDIKGYVTK